MIFSLRYTVPISGLWMWFVVFVLQVWIIIEKRDISFFPFCCKAPDRHQTCLFLTRTYLFFNLAVCCQLFGPSPPPGPLPLPLAAPSVFLWLPTSPPFGIRWDSPARTDQCSVDCPTLRIFKDGEKGSPGAETKALCCETIHQFLLARSPSILISSRTNHQCKMRHPTVWVCVGGAPCLCTRVSNVFQREKKDFFFLKKKRKNGHDAESLTLLLLLAVRAHTLTHTQLLFCPSVFSCSLQSTSSCCPPVGGAEVKSASQCFCLYLDTVFYYFSSNCL